MLTLQIIFLSLVGLVLPSKLKSNASDLHKIVSKLFAEKYDGEIRPNVENDQPVKCYLNFRINSMSALREVSMDYNVNIYLRLRWNEPRLSYGHHKGYENGSYTLSHKQFSKLWIPDVFIKNEKDGKLHDLVLPNRLLRLYPNGNILYSQRLSLTLACELDLARFPLDNQTCNFVFASYAHTLKDLEILWDNERNATAVAEGLKPPEFELLEISGRYCTSGTSTGAYACLEAILKFQRKVNYYLIQVYLPSLLVVVLSWVSFWIDTDAVPARITLGLLTVLTMTTQSSNFAARMPRVSYVKAIDVWMAMCLVFVFGALIEYSFVNVLARRAKPKQENMIAALVKQVHVHTNTAANGGDGRRSSAKDPKGRDEAETELMLRDGDKVNTAVCAQSCSKTMKNKAGLVDRFSRFMFPLAFGIFNLFYWVFYLTNKSSNQRR